MKIVINQKPFFENTIVICLAFLFLLPNDYFETFHLFLVLRWTIALIFGALELINGSEDGLYKNKLIQIIFIYYLYKTIIQLFLDYTKTFELFTSEGWFFFALLAFYGIFSSFNLNYQKILCLLLDVQILSNFASFLFFPNGLWVDNIRVGWQRAGYIFGIENQFSYFIIPILLLLLIYSTKKIFPFFNGICVAIGAITLYIGHSSTGKLAMTVFIILMFFGIFKTIKKSLNLKIVLIVYAIIWIAVVILQNISSLTDAIAKIFGKNSTFSERTVLWSEALKQIFRFPIFGQGYVIGGGYITIGTTTYAAHNCILQLLLTGGIILLGIFVVIFYFFEKKIAKAPLKVSYIISSGILCILITYLMESYSLNYLFIVLIAISRFVDVNNRGNAINGIIRSNFGGSPLKKDRNNKVLF